ncbi:MAG: hypothetical protein KGL39_43250 [Patescibacteria group bacterium]|nr:hypothetical protein [Patescibacteria group bacterium]
MVQILSNRRAAVPLRGGAWNRVGYGPTRERD